MYRQAKPWITKSIAKSCKKKQYLYKLYLKNRTKQSEDRYKKYKNKLTQIIRFNKRSYYHDLLVQHKNNIQGTWKVLNSIIRNGKINEAK